MVLPAAALPVQSRGNHDALVDARHNLRRFRICHQALPLRKDNKIR